jgi:hypothetical protein
MSPLTGNDGLLTGVDGSQSRMNSANSRSEFLV